MKKLLVLGMIVLIASMIHAFPLNEPKDIYASDLIKVKAKIAPHVDLMPETKTYSPQEMIITTIPNSSGHGGKSSSFQDHVKWCSAHRNFNLKTKKWENTPAISESQCRELWGREQLDKKIKYNSPKQFIFSKE